MSKFSKNSLTKDGYQDLSVYRLVPSIVTIIALCMGLTSMRYALDSKWEQSLLLLIIAAFLDGMDGRIARFLNVTSDFGAQLDSLADFVNFGVVPAVTIYLWSLNDIEIKGVGWGFVLVYAVCMALRLARFNTMDEEDIRRSEKYFFGVPAPFGAMLIILPMMLSFISREVDFAAHPIFVGVYMLVIGFAMASRIPTFSIKKMHVSKDNVTIVLAFFGFLVAAIIIHPWMTFSVICALYILSIPFSFWKYVRKK
ncbi:MAG: phosphatidylcholine/phosphatidylserine synthase [Rickettsiales bacterium]